MKRDFIIGSVFGMVLLLTFYPIVIEAVEYYGKFPPTRAIANITTSSETVKADSYLEEINFIGGNGIKIFGNNTSKEIMINSTSFTIFKTVTETINNSTTLHNDAELCFDEEAGINYQIDMFMRVAGTATADFQYKFSHAILTSGNGFSFGAWVSTFGSNGLNINNPIPVVLGSTQIFVFPQRLYLLNGGNSGEFCLQWAQNTLQVSDLDVMVGSWMKVIQTPQ